MESSGRGICAWVGGVGQVCNKTKFANGEEEILYISRGSAALDLDAEHIFRINIAQNSPIFTMAGRIDVHHHYLSDAYRKGIASFSSTDPTNNPQRTTTPA